MSWSLGRVVRLLHVPTGRGDQERPAPVTIDRTVVQTLAHVAHEIRQPLCAAIAACHVIRSTHRDASSKHASAVLDRQLKRISRLVDDLIDAARLHVHRPSLQISRIDIRLAAQEVADAVAPQVAAKHQHLTLTMAKEPLLVDGDWVRLDQIVSNLVTNAINYTEPGGFIRMSVEQQGDQAVLTVADTGRGISSDLLQHVFEPFVQGASESPHGLGIGLAVARQLVELHHGRIDARSPGPGGGSTFIVSIPLAPMAPRGLGPTDHQQVH
jgi:signal transduction histidine kinase